MLEREFRFYQDHKEELDTRYDGKFIVVVGHEVIGPFDSHSEAIKEAAKGHRPGTFLVQKCSTTEDQSQFFHSRVAL